MSAVLERAIAAKRKAQIAPVTPPHWRREIQGDAGRYDGAFSYALPGAAKTLEIAETAASTGTKVWDCAVALARMFEYNTNKTASPLAIRASERVLELGGGSGLLALALAALGADVTTTDAAPVVPHLRKTIDANAGSVPRTPTVAALDWRDADHTTMGAFPVVVASDVLVCVQWAEDVARVLAAVAAVGNVARGMLKRQQQRQQQQQQQQQVVLPKAELSTADAAAAARAVVTVTKVPCPPLCLGAQEVVCMADRATHTAPRARRAGRSPRRPRAMA